MHEIILRVQSLYNMILIRFQKLNKHSKRLLILGVCAQLLLFCCGTLLLGYVKYQNSLDEMGIAIATSMIKNSFIILAESVIGALLIDHFKQNTHK